MRGRLEGKKVLITAAARGIGRASALLFESEGAEVWATDVDVAGLASLAAERPSIRARVLDVLSTRSVEEAVEEIGNLDGLFNCAGHVHQGDVLSCSEQQWEFSMNLNVGSMFRMCRAFLPAMKKAASGSIVNMSSVVSSIKGAPNRCAYSASKAAVIGLTKSIAADFAASGIRCNALCPGTVDTPSLKERMSAQGDEDGARALFVSRQPMGRLGRPEEIAAAALYLCSDESSFMTGQAFVIDGGMAL